VTRRLSGWCCRCGGNGRGQYRRHYGCGGGRLGGWNCRWSRRWFRFLLLAFLTIFFRCLGLGLRGSRILWNRSLRLFLFAFFVLVIVFFAVLLFGVGRRGLLRLGSRRL
jgi:hypothetical protein